VSSGVGFLHLAQPRPVVHGGLNPSSIFLDRNFVAKIHALKLTPCSDEAQVQADVCAFGNLLLQLLTGRNWAGLNQDSMMINKEAILDALDDNAGGWPLDLAEEVARLAMKCRSVFLEPNVAVAMSSVTEELNNLKKVADDLVARRDYHVRSEDFSYCREDSSHVPNIFICPIFQVCLCFLVQSLLLWVRIQVVSSQHKQTILVRLMNTMSQTELGCSSNSQL